MTWDLRDYQIVGRDIAVEHLLAGVRDSYKMISAPTGSGKSVIELEVLNAVPGAYLVTPSLEIVRGMLAKLGLAVPENDEEMAEAGQAQRIWTPIRLRNKLMLGLVARPTGLIWDEAHHEQSDSWREVSALCGDCPAVGFTATPYRGTPRSTGELLSRWGHPITLLSLRDSVQRGFTSLPTLQIVPLLDDDIIEVKDGEFSVSSANKEIGSRVADVSRIIEGYYNGTEFDKPTMLAVPSTECVGYFLDYFSLHSVPASGVTAGTCRSDRQKAFDSCVERRAILVQIKVVSEGVDLPIRRLIDMYPTLSPVRWLQQFGRITRPGGESEYICCCRNLLRHAYLLEGLVPPVVIAEGQALMGVGKRASARAVGLEGVGKFKAAEIKFLDGTIGQLFSVSQLDNGAVSQYNVLCHPTQEKPLVARRIYSASIPPNKRGKWEQIETIPDLTGFQSVPPQEVTPKMAAWWRGEGNMRGAEFYGLDPNVKLSRKNFQALPMLANLRVRFAAN